MALPGDLKSQYEKHMKDASNFYTKVEWEDMAKSLEQAKRCCEQPCFPDRIRSKQKVYEQYGSLERRYGRFRNAAIVLEAGLRLAETDDSNKTFQDIIASAEPSHWQGQSDTLEDATLEHIALLGELGMTYRHLDDLGSAEKAFEMQSKLATRLSSQMQSVQADAEICRSVGNLGLVLYLRALFEIGPETVEGRKLLDAAIASSYERRERCRLLREKLDKDPTEENSRILKGRLIQWDAIAEARLTVCFIAKKDVSEALRHGQLVVDICKDLADSTMRAHARFYLGFALWLAGKRGEAKAQWEFHSDDYAPDKGTPAIAFSKEPSREYRYYLDIMVEAGVRMDHLDEHGYTALDYAVFSGDEETQDIILKGLRNRSEDEAVLLAMLHDAHLKRYYRIIFQEHFRPAFSNGEKSCIQNAKLLYLQLRASDKQMASNLNGLKFVKYTTFKDYGRLPRFDDHDAVESINSDNVDTDIVFMSYRWIGGTNQDRHPNPDDAANTQYRRMCDALQQLLLAEGINEHKLGIWLDIACIDQTNKGPGIAALPLAIAQCQYMLSFVDSEEKGYYTRAWCCSEVLMMSTLEKSYHRHKRFEHVLIDEASSKTEGILALPRNVSGNLKPSEQNISYEADREQIRFLERQARFLGS